MTESDLFQDCIRVSAFGLECELWIRSSKAYSHNLITFKSDLTACQQFDVRLLNFRSKLLHRQKGPERCAQDLFQSAMDFWEESLGSRGLLYDDLSSDDDGVSQARNYFFHTRLGLLQVSEMYPHQ